jgi:hypothetical protein
MKVFFHHEWKIFDHPTSYNVFQIAFYSNMDKNTNVSPTMPPLCAKKYVPISYGHTKSLSTFSITVFNYRFRRNKNLSIPKARRLTLDGSGTGRTPANGKL